MAFDESFGEFPGSRIPVRYLGNDLNTQELNSASVFDTDAVVLNGATRIGLFINITNEDATGTLDIDIEFSPDKGVTYVGMPISANSETEATLAQFAATGSKFKWWEVCTDMSFGRVRAELTQGTFTASEGFTYGPCFWIIGRR